MAMIAMAASAIRVVEVVESLAVAGIADLAWSESAPLYAIARSTTRDVVADYATGLELAGAAVVARAGALPRPAVGRGGALGLHADAVLLRPRLYAALLGPHLRASIANAVGCRCPTRPYLARRRRAYWLLAVNAAATHPRR